MASNCTRELKQRPIDAYLRDYAELSFFKEHCKKEGSYIFDEDYKNGTWKLTTAYERFKEINKVEVIKVLGIRADEAHRKSVNAEIEKVIYPLCD